VETCVRIRPLPAMYVGRLRAARGRTVRRRTTCGSARKCVRGSADGGRPPAA